MSPWGPFRPLVDLALALSVAASLSAAAPTAAQTYRSPLAAFAAGGSELSHAAPEPRWDGIAFPARTSRRYKRAPKSAGLEQRRQSCDPHFVDAAKLYKLPVDFLRAVAHVESGFYTHALSVDRAMGIMQLMPFTARKMGVTRPEDARQNILGGARFLRILANQWSGNIVLTLASYNAGAGAVKKYGGVPPYAETQRYVRRVLARFQAYALERKQQERRDAAVPPARSSIASRRVPGLRTPTPEPARLHLTELSPLTDPGGDAGLKPTKERTTMDEKQITRALEAGYTIRIVASTGALRNAPAGESFRSVVCFEERLERARTERNTVGAVLHWSLHTDDRAITYEGRFVFDGTPVDVCASMHRHSEAVLARESLFTPPIVARAKVARLAAAALAAATRRARAAHLRNSERVFELAVAMLHTSLGRNSNNHGKLRVVRGQA